MRALKLIFLMVLFFLQSCSKENERNDTVKSEFRLEIVEEIASDSDRIIASMDIKSYNAKTGELVFENKLPEDMDKWMGVGYKVKAYANSKADLFSLHFATAFMSAMRQSPVLHYSLIDTKEPNRVQTEKDKWYLLSGYPYGDLLNAESIKDDEQLKNFKAIELGWKRFVEELEKSKMVIH